MRWEYGRASTGERLRQGPCQKGSPRSVKGSRQGKCGGDGPFPSRRREDRQPLNLSYGSKTALGDKGRASHTNAKTRPRWPARSVVQTHGALQTSQESAAIIPSTAWVPNEGVAHLAPIVPPSTQDGLLMPHFPGLHGAAGCLLFRRRDCTWSGSTRLRGTRSSVRQALATAREKHQAVASCLSHPCLRGADSNLIFLPASALPHLRPDAHLAAVFQSTHDVAHCPHRARRTIRRRHRIPSLVYCGEQIPQQRLCVQYCVLCRGAWTVMCPSRTLLE
jgi:hypothetical protein